MLPPTKFFTAALPISQLSAHPSSFPVPVCRHPELAAILGKRKSESAAQDPGLVARYARQLPVL